MSRSVFSVSEAAKCMKADAQLMASAGRSESVQVLRLKEKLRKIEQYRDLDDEALTAEVDKHINPEELFVSFSHLCDPNEALDGLVDEAEAFSDGVQTREEEQQARLNADRRHSDAANLPVYLFFSKLQSLEDKGAAAKFAGSLVGRFACKHGPLHAALMVGDVIVEWGTASLVVPQRKSVFRPIFRVGLQPQNSYWLDYVTKRRSEMFARTEGVMHYAEQLGCIFDIHTGRRKLIDELIRIIIKYNKYYHYHVFARNCQHFVNDAMKALGLPNPRFKGQMREYYEQLRRNQRRGEFESHAALDSHVRDKLKTLSHEQLDFMYCQYLCFHTAAGMVDERTWNCTEPTCLLHQVCDRLEELERAAVQGVSESSNGSDAASS